MQRISIEVEKRERGDGVWCDMRPSVCVSCLGKFLTDTCTYMYMHMLYREVSAWGFKESLGRDI